MKTKNITLAIALALLLVASILDGCVKPDTNVPDVASKQLQRFGSDKELLDALEEAQTRGRGGWFGGPMLMKAGMEESATVTAAPSASDTGAGREYSETNVQVEGVDEADIIKTDGEYIYTLSGNKVIIAKAYPAEEAKILSELTSSNFNPTEIFIHGDRLLVFGSSYYNFETEDQGEVVTGKIMAERYPRYGGGSFTTLKLYDMSNREGIKLLKSVDFEGNYLTSRKIGPDAYFVINSYPNYRKDIPCGDIVPLYRESVSDDAPKKEDMKPIASCTEIGYIEPIQANNFITIASMSMTDEAKEVKKETIVGSGQNVYASLENLYIAQTSWTVYTEVLGELAEDQKEKTVITKFKLGEGDIKFLGTGNVKGKILNQFSMDEYESHFRIATTIQGYESNRDTSTNNMYVLDEGLTLVGKVEGIAPGESIYSVRFMGKRAYMVTFKHVDPLFVLDLSVPESPAILGKLKIPGYSEYLHPYDETHLIGIGKEVDESIDAEKVHTEGAVYYTAIQGVKLAVFDVSDVANPVEMYKEVIGDRGTQSEAATDHKAFLFDKEKSLLVIPITLAERKPGQDISMEGEFTFQGAYVYDLTLENGFNLKGRISHYDTNEEFMKSGSYFRGDSGSSIRRSLYIEDVLYTFSNTRLQLNDLENLEKLNALQFSTETSQEERQSVQGELAFA